MKILFITKELPFPVDNGHRMRSINILKGVSQNNTLDIVTFAAKDGEYAAKELKPYYAKVSFISHNQIHSKRHKLMCLMRSLGNGKPYSIELRSSEDMRKCVGSMLEKGNYDAVVCDGIHMMVNIPQTPTKILLFEHNIESLIIERYAKVAGEFFKKRFAQWEFDKMKDFEIKNWQRCAQCFVCSEHDSSYLKSASRQTHVAVVANGVDVENYKQRDNIVKKPNSLIYTGLMNWAPNEDAVLYFAKAIYPLIKIEVPDVKFDIVGKDPRRCLLDLARKDPSIRVTGFVQDITASILQSEVFIVPLRIGSGTRLKILEALSLQIPVVSTSIGCEGIEVGQGKNILIADDPKGFSRMVINVLKNKQEYVQLGTQGRRLVEEKYSWSKIRADISDMLRQVI